MDKMSAIVRTEKISSASTQGQILPTHLYRQTIESRVRVDNGRVLVDGVDVIDQLEKLTERVNQLTTMLECMPGGLLYDSAKKRFEENM